MPVRDNGLQYVLAAPARTITYNPTNFNPPGYFLKDIEFRSALRVEESDRPQDHGSYLDPSWRSGVSGIIEADVLPSSWSNRETLVNQLFEAYASMTGQRGGATLTWTPLDSSAARRLTDLQIISDITQIRRGGGIKGYHVAMKSRKPYAESASATTVDTTVLTAGGSGFSISLTIPIQIMSSGGGLATVTNSGNVEVKPILQIHGPATSPTVHNVTAGKKLVFTGSIAAGDYWEIDLFAKTVTLLGQTTINTMVVPQSTWFDLGVGDTVLQLAASQFTAVTKLRTLMRSAWV